MERYKGLTVLPDNKALSLEEFANRLNIPEGEMKNLLLTIKAIDSKTDFSDMQADYRQLRLRLWTPNSMVARVETLAELCKVKAHSFWQALWIETLFNFANKLPADMESKIDE